MADDDRQRIRVFLASPGDLQAERQEFKEQIERLNNGFGDGAGVIFEAAGWEDVCSTVGCRPQSLFNKQVDACDVFVLAMFRRWGSKAPDSAYDSYTEEEFHRALDRWGSSGKPSIFVFFKNVDAESIADPGEELEKVLRFRRKMEESNRVLYRTFSDACQFAGLIDEHLRKYVQGRLPEPCPESHAITVSAPTLECLEQAEHEARRLRKVAERSAGDADVESAWLSELSFIVASQASRLAGQGHLEEARELFSKLLPHTDDIHILYLAFEFFDKAGDFAQAERVLQRWVELVGQDGDPAQMASALGNLAVLHARHGDLAGAETATRRALETVTQTGEASLIAAGQYNLAQVLRARGDIDGAEHALRAIIDLRAVPPSYTASALADLGLLYWTRGDYEEAETWVRQSIAIAEEQEIEDVLGRAQGHYGLILREQGNLEAAQDLLQKSLTVAEKLQQPEALARAYANLGVLLRCRGELDGAEDLLNQSLAINRRYGRREGIADDYGELGVVYWMRGDLDTAQKMIDQSLTVNQQLGRNEAMARLWERLTVLCHAKSDSVMAQECQRRAASIYKRVGLCARGVTGANEKAKAA